MQPFEGFLNHLAGVEHSSGGSQEVLSSNLLLAALILALRPQRILELSMGTAELSTGMLHAMNMAGSGSLTIVDDWSAWNGIEPDGIDLLRRAGVVVEAPIRPEDYIRKDNGGRFDLVVCRADLADDPLRMKLLVRLCRTNGRLIVYGVNRSRQNRFRQYLAVHKPDIVMLDGLSDRTGGWVVIGPAGEQVDHQTAGNQLSSDPEPLYLGLVQGDGYGWGVCSRYLITELTRLRPVHVLNDSDGTSSNAQLDGTLFQALVDLDFHSMFPNAKARRNVGYTFFENELTAASVENAKNFDLVLGGSTWCRERMQEKGITNCDVLIQGIDPKLFRPIEEHKPGDRFVIFSGGKFELRKGQDLVLRAVKIMQDRYPDVWLVNCWYNLWPASTRLMTYSRHIRFEHKENESWQETMQRTYLQNGLDPGRIRTFDLLPQAQQRDLYAQTDIGLFPNRCEGGTNLVLMEYMACAKPVIASNTSGHRDILNAHNALLLNDLSDYNVKDRDGRLIARWKEPALEELLERLEYAYHHRSILHSIGQTAGEHLKKFTWKHSALNLIRLMGL